MVGVDIVDHKPVFLFFHHHGKQALRPTEVGVGGGLGGLVIFRKEHFTNLINCHLNLNGSVVGNFPSLPHHLARGYLLAVLQHYKDVGAGGKL